MSVMAAAVRVGERTGLMGGLQLAERVIGRRLVGAVERALLSRDEYFMRLALREAERALEHDDVPVGAWSPPTGR